MCSEESKVIKKEKTILFVMPRLPFPAVSGRKTSLYHYCRILSEELGYRLVVAAFLESGDHPEEKPSFIDRLVILPKPSGKIKILNILKDSILFKRKPMQVSLYWNPKVKSVIDQLVREEFPEIAIADMVRCTEYIKDIPGVRIADLDDRISLRYERQLRNDIDGINPYGAYLNIMPKIIQGALLWRPVKLYVVKNEIALLKKYELEMGSCCESTIFVAQKEADQFNEELGEKKAVAIPIGVDETYFSYRHTGKDGNYIGFLGALSVAHNENAVWHFVKDILPLIIKKIPDVKFLIIGGGASEKLLELKSEHIVFTGRVDDVRDYLEKCKVFVCPMTFGSGIKTKNLEAMALGLPVITTSIGAENINASDGVDWIVADQNDDFADAVIRILMTEKRRIEMGHHAADFIKDNFTWEKASVQFKRLFEH